MVRVCNDPCHAPGQPGIPHADTQADSDMCGLAFSGLMRVMLKIAWRRLDVGMREMMTHPCCVIGLADSGAHVGAQTDSCNATYLMSYWVRDRNKLTGRDGIELEQAVYLHTKEPADICGLTDRGALQ